MSARRIQLMIAAVFLILGGWCMLAPKSVVTLTLLPSFQSEDEIVPLLIACFGAQAILAGLFAAFSVFTRRTFFVFGATIIGFLVFDYYFYFVEPVFNEFIVLDAVGNVIFLVLCVLGYRELSKIRS